LRFINLIRKEFGLHHYIWIYTNGDLVTRKKLKLLKNAGINEIRFDLAARNYDLKPLELAVGTLDVVTVEIPAIPEDVDLVKSLLTRLEKIGVKYLNLHQLFLNDVNYARLSKRNYTFLKSKDHTGYPVIESEFAAYEILTHATRIKSKIGINFCSSTYKNRFQLAARGRRLASLCLKDFDTITKTGLIRRFVAEISKKNLETFIKACKKSSSYKLKWIDDLGIDKGLAFQINPEPMECADGKDNEDTEDELADENDPIKRDRIRKGLSETYTSLGIIKNDLSFVKKAMCATRDKTSEILKMLFSIRHAFSLHQSLYTLGWIIVLTIYAKNRMVSKNGFILLASLR